MPCLLNLTTTTVISATGQPSHVTYFNSFMCMSAKRLGITPFDTHCLGLRICVVCAFHVHATLIIPILITTQRLFFKSCYKEKNHRFNLLFTLTSLPNTRSRISFTNQKLHVEAVTFPLLRHEKNLLETTHNLFP